MTDINKIIEPHFRKILKVLSTYQDYLSLNNHFSLFGSKNTFSDGTRILHRDTVNKIIFGYTSKYYGVDTYIPPDLLKYSIDEHHLLFPFIQTVNLGVKGFILLNECCKEICFGRYDMDESALRDPWLLKSYPNNEHIKRWLQSKIQNNKNTNSRINSVEIPLYFPVNYLEELFINHRCTNEFIKKSDEVPEVVSYINGVITNILASEYETKICANITRPRFPSFSTH